MSLKRFFSLLLEVVLVLFVLLSSSLSYNGQGTVPSTDFFSQEWSVQSSLWINNGLRFLFLLWLLTKLVPNRWRQAFFLGTPRWKDPLWALFYWFSLLGALFILGLFFELIFYLIIWLSEIFQYTELNSHLSKIWYQLLEEKIHWKAPKDFAKLGAGFLSMVTIGFLEEGIFRLWLIQRLRHYKLSSWEIVLSSSLIFSSFHLYYGSLGLFVTFLMSLYLCLIYYKTKFNFYIVAWLHSFHNFFVLFFLFLTS